MDWSELSGRSCLWAEDDHSLSPVHVITESYTSRMSVCQTCEMVYIKADTAADSDEILGCRDSYHGSAEFGKVYFATPGQYCNPLREPYDLDVGSSHFTV